jgi:ferredoxin
MALGHSGSHISQLMHFLVINSAIRKISETTQTGRAMGDSIYEINSDRCTECVGHYDTPTCQKVCPIPNTILINAVTHRNGLIGALRLAHIAVDAFFGN